MYRFLHTPQFDPGSGEGQRALDDNLPSKVMEQELETHNRRPAIDSNSVATVQGDRKGLMAKVTPLVNKYLG